MEKKYTCYRCKYFEKFYLKEPTQFKPIKLGRCEKTDLIVCTTDGCEKYEAKPKSERIDFLLRCRIGDLLTEISELRKLVEAEEREKDEM